jgi:hypothetical protein
MGPLGAEEVMRGIMCIYKRDPQGDSYPFHCMRIWSEEELSVDEPGSVSSLDTLTLKSSTSNSVRNRFLLFISQLVYVIL